MANFNNCMLIGNLTGDPELRYTPGGAAVADLRLAVNRKWTTKDGESQEEVLFIDVTVWNRVAENCCKFLAKGRSVFVNGYLKMENWEDKTTGDKRSRIKVVADNVQFLGSPKDGGGEADSDGRGPSPRSA